MTTPQPHQTDAPNQPTQGEASKPGRFDNANWFARFSLFFMVMCIVLSGRLGDGWPSFIPLVCLILAVATAVIGLMTKPIDKWEKFMAIAALVLAALQVILIIYVAIQNS